ncbi:MAG: DUF5752 family protein [bacterium]|nr:DUF5752 family protein [bacterium]
MKTVFKFKTEFWIPTYTKISATTIYDFRIGLKIIPPNSLLYHFYINIFNYHSVPSIYTNSFAYWFYKNGYYQIGEEISSIDPTDYFDIEKLRQDLIDIISRYQEQDIKTLSEPFLFLSIQRNIFHTNLKATNLEELIDGIKKSSINSIFYHLITSKVDNKKAINDYSEFLNLIGQYNKAELINKIDVYALNLYEIKELILEVLTK